MARAKKAVEVDPNKLKRERAGRYVTPDGRFAVEGPSANGWYIVDSERENELGLPLMAGPFATLDDARDEVPKLREGVLPTPVLPSRDGADTTTDASDDAAGGADDAADADDEAPKRPQRDRRTADHRATEPRRTRPRPTLVPDHPTARHATADDERGQPASPPEPRQRRSTGPTAPRSARPESANTAPTEPAWMSRVEGPQRADALRLIALLREVGIDDPAIVRRDIEANLPEVAHVLLAADVRRRALDPWRDPDELLDRITSLDRDVRRHLRSVLGPALDAAERAVRSAESADDLAAFAWLVAIRTAAAVFESIEQEGRDARVTGEPGWRLLELDGRREPTRRAITIEVSDLVTRPGD